MMNTWFARCALALALGGVAAFAQDEAPARQRDRRTPANDGVDGPEDVQAPQDERGGARARSDAQRGDEALAQAVDHALKSELGDEFADGLEVDVTPGGQVALLGVVEDAFTRKRAVCIAEGVQGVTAVEDRMVVDVEDVPDNDELASWVRDAIKQDPVTKACVITYVVSDGVVTLRGDVDSYAEKRLILENVTSLDGVREVRDELQLSRKAPGPGEDLGQALERRFQGDAQLGGGAGLTAQARGGEVRLSGTVPSAKARQRAIETAFLLGATKVEADDLTVDPRWTQQDAEQGRTDEERTLPAGHARGAATGDDSLSGHLQDALRTEPRLEAFQVQPAVKEGVVTLSGVVSNYAAKARAEQLAWDLAGVRGVQNDIVVTPVTRVDDDAIEEALDRGFSRHAALNERDIDFEVEDGRVTLEGEVRSSFERELATCVASRVAGVVDVQDELDVATRADEPLRDDELEDRIRSQLFWSPFVSAGDITVTCEDGVCTLTGEVDSWAEVTAATENAMQGGARRVVNELRVKED
jgi:osmotically-inducible protein OsmY